MVLPVSLPKPTGAAAATPWALYRLLILRAWAHHPWRQLLCVFTMALGVALAYSVHLVNASALAEFSQAVRQTHGTPDAVLRPAGAQGAGPAATQLDDAWFEELAAAPQVRAASPVVEIDTLLISPQGQRVPVRVWGVDALRLPEFAPELMPRPRAGLGATALVNETYVFANPAALARLATWGITPEAAGPHTVQLQQGTQALPFTLAGTVAAGGPALLVMDIASAQMHFGRLGQLSRIDLRLAPGTDAQALAQRLPWGPLVRLAAADEGVERMSNLSRAYRVNLTVLALVALCVGAFMVYSVLALAVAQATPWLALLGVLGLDAPQRQRLVWLESALLGLAGAVLGLLGGTAMAWTALRWLAGDLGAGYFGSAAAQAPALNTSVASALGFGALGVAAAWLGGWLPSRQAAALAPAQALKGLGSAGPHQSTAWPGLGLLAGGGLLALLPAWQGVPVAAYASVALLLFGGVALVPSLVHALLGPWPAPRHPLALLALQRARHQRHVATAAVAGVVASLALCVALTVMVASFRLAVTSWLDQVLPADLYARTAGSAAATDQAFLEADFLARAQAVPGVARVAPSRVRPLALRPGQPAVALLARPLPDAAKQLPLIGPPLPASALQPGEVAVYVSEAMVALYGTALGETFTLPLGEVNAGTNAGTAPEATARARVLGVWRDYARQFGTIAIDLGTYQALTGDTRINELAVWLQAGASADAVRLGLTSAARGPWLEFADTAQLRQTSLRIFDRSFAVTRYLQAVAIVIGLVGMGASLSAQVLARRKEFGLLAHLGLTRLQMLTVVCGEAACWLLVGTLAGLLLGVMVSGVLVYVVNPQSFHWTMPIHLPVGPLAGLAAAVLATGLLASAAAARGALQMSAVRAVREDW